MTQGGLATAQFDCRQPYEDILDLVFGNYVIWGTLGCELSSPASAGASSLTVSNLLNQGPFSFRDVIAGDVILITDGKNTEFFQVGAISGIGPTWTMTLNSPGGEVLDLPAVLLNSYAAGATIVRLQWQGYITQRLRSTAFDNQFSINSNGFFNRYAGIFGNSNVQGKDGAHWLQSALLSIAGEPSLTTGSGGGGDWPIGTTVFGCSDTIALAVGEQVRIGTYGSGEAEFFTITVINGGAGTFTVNHASAKVHHKGDIVVPKGVSTAPNLSAIVADKALLVDSSFPVNIQATDTALSTIIATVVRQETGSQNDPITYAAWVDALRQVHHGVINSTPPHVGETKLTQDAAAGFGTAGNPFKVASMAQIKVGRRVFIAGAAGTDSLLITAVHPAFNSFETSPVSTFAHLKGDVVVAMYDVTPTFTMSLSDNGSGFGDTINKIQTTDMDGSQLINAAVVTGTTIQQNGTEQTTFATTVLAGNTVFPLAAMPFQVGDDVILSPNSGQLGGPVRAETLTIGAISGNTITTTSPSTKDHKIGETIELDTSGGAGPRIIILQTDSIDDLGWFEGTLSSPDIATKTGLKTWGNQQIRISAWPLANDAIDLDVASCRITGRDLLEIPGFSNGIPLFRNVSQIQYQWLAAQQNVTASIQSGVLKSTAGATIKEINGQHSVRLQHKNPRKRPHNESGHMGGGSILPNADNTFTIAAATVKHGGVPYQVPAFSGVAPEGESMWGADLSNPASPVIGLLPSTVINGRSVYAEAIFTVTDDAGPTEIDSFLGVPLWRVECRGGVIQGIWPLFATSGVNLGNLPSITLPPAPTVSSATPSAAALTSGIACDLALLVAFSNIPQDGATHEIKYYMRTNGTTNWSHKFTRKIPGLPLPSDITLNDTAPFSNIPLGVAVDIGASYSGTNGETAVTALVTNFSLPAMSSGSVNSATESTQAVVTAATQVLAASAGRIGVIITNRANSPMFIGTDGTLTPTLFWDEVGPGQTWTMPVSYTGAIWLCWAAADSNAGAQANIAAFPS